MLNMGRIFSTKHLGKYFKGQFHIFSHAEVFKKLIHQMMGIIDLRWTICIT